MSALETISLRKVGVGLLLSGLAVASASGQDWRAELGEETAQAVEGLVRAAYPGSEVGWRGRTQVLLPGGLQRRLVLTGLRKLRVDGGDGFLGCVELEEDRKGAVRILEELKDRPAAAVTKLARVRFGPQGEVAEQIAVSLDSDAVVTECRKTRLREGTQSGTQSVVEVEYEAMDGGTDWTGAIRWVATFNLASLVLLERAPVVFRVRKTEAEKMDAFISKRLEGGAIEILQASNNHSVYRCASPCVVPAQAIWGLR